MAGPEKKMMQLNFFEAACCGSVSAIGQWKSPTDNSRTKDTLEYYLWLAKITEKGKISSIFFSDSYGGDSAYTGGAHVGKFEPTLVISAMAAVTSSVSFGITGSTSYIAPYILARSYATLDHLTGGRVAWNIVTSWSNSAAKAMGKEAVMSHDDRYAAADEYMDIVYSLWEKSWEDGAQVWQEEPEMAYDPSKIHKIEYRGKYHQIHAAHQTHPGPQRTPLLFQAGASKAGIAFGGKHAEAIFCSHPTIASCKEYTSKVRRAAVEAGRKGSDVKFFLNIMPIIGRTMEEAAAKHEAARKRISVVGGMARFKSFTAVDLSEYPLDEPFAFEGKQYDNAIQGIINNIKTMGEERPITPRYLAEMMAFGGTGPENPVGTPEMVADVFELWWREGDVDGFNVQYVSNPGSWEDVVELLVPELQKRGVYWNDYAVPGGTLRENMMGAAGKPYLPDNHPGSAFKWNAPQSPVKAEEAKNEDEMVNEVKRNVSENIVVPVAEVQATA